MPRQTCCQHFDCASEIFKLVEISAGEGNAMHCVGLVRKSSQALFIWIHVSTKEPTGINKCKCSLSKPKPHLV